MNTHLETVTLAGGCFWCVEAIFKRLKGVHTVISGYSGGTHPNPTYDMVSTGVSGYAEAIQVEFDPTVISYEKLLQIFFHTHNPTTLNQQGNDIGSQYRSAIFYHSEEQKKIAERVKRDIEQEKVWGNPFVTEIIPFQKFYKAEEYHQNYYENNQNKPYCTLVINPKIHKLLQEFKKEVKEEYQ